MHQGRFRHEVYPFSYATFRADIARLNKPERIRLRTILVARLERDTAHLSYCETVSQESSGMQRRLRTGTNTLTNPDNHKGSCRSRPVHG